LIVTLTINPTIDRVISVDRLAFEDRAYINSTRETAGGRGINASYVIHSYGGETLALLTSGGDSGKRMEGHLKNSGFPFQPVSIEGQTRTNLTITDKHGLTVNLNEKGPARAKDQVGWIVTRLDDPSKTADIAKTIDKGFEDREIQTLSQDERSFQTSFLAMFSAILSAIDIVSVAIMVIMMLILGNTIAMAVRERTSEYGVLRAVGFLPRHVAFFVLGESAVIGVVGGVLGVAISYPIVEKGLGRFIEENMGTFFPYFRIDGPMIVAALLLATVLGLVAAAIPAYRASKVSVVDALRKVG